MKLLMEDKDVALLLSEKRDYIGKKITLDTVVAAISLLVSCYSSNFTPIFGFTSDMVRAVFIFVAFVYIIKVCIDLYNCTGDRKYNKDTLLSDIKELNEVQHDHSLIAIKNEKNQFLVYDDERWTCKLFPNYKTSSIDNEGHLKESIASDLNIDSVNVGLKFISARTQEKYSYSHNENRMYHHRLYLANVNDINEENDFISNNKHYYWMSLEDMLQDEVIKKKNLEVVDFVRECIK